jgi:hypothetical protein
MQAMARALGAYGVKYHYEVKIWFYQPSLSGSWIDIEHITDGGYPCFCVVDY